MHLSESKPGEHEEWALMEDVEGKACVTALYTFLE